MQATLWPRAVPAGPDASGARVSRGTTKRTSRDLQMRPCRGDGERGSPLQGMYHRSGRGGAGCCASPGTARSPASTSRGRSRGGDGTGPLATSRGTRSWTRGARTRGTRSWRPCTTPACAGSSSRTRTRTTSGRSRPCGQGRLPRGPGRARHRPAPAGPHRARDRPRPARAAERDGVGDPRQLLAPVACPVVHRVLGTGPPDRGAGNSRIEAVVERSRRFSRSRG